MYFKLFLEFGRILGEADVKETMSVDWKTRWSGKIINLAKREQQYYAINCWMDLYFSQRESEGGGNFCAVLVRREFCEVIGFFLL